MTTIRPLRAEDRPDWDKLWTAYLDYYETSVTKDVYDMTFQRLLGDDPQDFTCLIAEHDGAPVGLSIIGPSGSDRWLLGLAESLRPA